MGTLTRRGFLKNVGLGGATVSGLALGGHALKGKALAASEKTIKWGFLDCMSGTFGAFGKGNVGGTKMAVKQINEAGGILGRPVEIIIEDTEANTEVAARKARNPRTNERVDVPERMAVAFKPGKEMARRIALLSRDEVISDRKGQQPSAPSQSLPHGDRPAAGPQLEI